MFWRFFAFVVVFLSGTSSLLSQAVPELIGQWELTDPEGVKRCQIVLRSDRLSNGYKLDPHPDCSKAFPRFSKISVWNFKNNALDFLEFGGKIILKFSEVESNLYETRVEGDGILFLQSLALSQSHVDFTPEKMGGVWSLVKGGLKPCFITLASDFSLRLKSDCDREFTRLDLASWTLSVKSVELKNKKGEIFRLEPAEENIWRGSGDRNQALILSRP